MHRHWRVGCSVLMLLGVLDGCSSSDGPVSPGPPAYPLAGTWQGSDGSPGIAYLVLRPDSSFVEYSTIGPGFRDLYEGTVTITESSLAFEGREPVGYTLSADTLRLFAARTTDTMVRTGAAPAVSAWLQSLTVLDSLPAPTGDAPDLAWDGSRLWYGSKYNVPRALYRIDPRTGASSTVPTANFVWAVEWDGTHLWCSNNGYERIFRVDPATGGNLAFSVEMGAWITGIALVGPLLWCSSHNERMLYAYDPATDAVLDTLSVGAQVHGMAYDGVHLFMCVNGRVNRCTTAPLEVLATYRLGDLYIDGIAFDGAGYWISAEDFPADTARIYNVRM